MNNSPTYNVFALVSFFMGILSLFFGWVPFIGWLFSVVVIACGIIAMYQVKKEHALGEVYAIMAIVFGIISLFLSLIVFGGILLLGSVEPAPAPAPPDYDYGNFTIQYDWVQDDSHLFMEDYFRETQWFEKNVDKLNQDWILPQNITVVFTECGVANAFYNSKDLTITMCYELADDIWYSFYQMMPDADRNVLLSSWLGAMDFIFYHELGHAFVDVFDLPITGREEDVADQLSVFIVSESWDAGEDSALAGAQYFYTHGGSSAFWDEHSLSEQRVYNIICWLFGRSPGRFAHLVPEFVPQERGVQCPGEWKQIDNAMTTLLDAHRKQLPE